MGNHPTSHSNTCHLRRWESKASPSGSYRHQWHIMDSPYWCSLVRHAGTISTLPNMSPSIPGIGESRGVPSNPGDPYSRSGETGQIQTCRVLHRRDLCGGEKGAPESEKPSGARVPRSWQLQTALVFLSPSTRLLLAHMKSPLSKTLSPDALLAPHLRELLGILRMTVTPSISDLLDGE